MGTLSIRNRIGELVEPDSFSATDVKNTFGRILDAVASKGIVQITRHDQARAVMLSMDEFHALVAPREDLLGSLTAQFDAMYAAMQKPGAAQASRKALFETPEKAMGRIALKGSARRRRG